MIVARIYGAVADRDFRRRDAEEGRDLGRQGAVDILAVAFETSRCLARCLIVFGLGPNTLSLEFNSRSGAGSPSSPEYYAASLWGSAVWIAALNGCRWRARADK